MKEFMFLIRKPNGPGMSAEKHETFLKACETYIGKLQKEGRLLSAQPMARQGTIISGSGDQWKDVNFDEGKEIIAGYYHIRANNLDEAVEIAKGNPEFSYSENARIEVRPMKMSEESTKYVYPTHGK